MYSLFFTALNSIVVYLFIIFAIRIFGKRELSQLSVIDLVFILLISNSVQNAMVGSNTTLMGGLVAATALFVTNTVLQNIFFRSELLSKLLQGEPLMLIYNGKILTKHLTKARLSSDELEAAIREHGVATVEDVDLAVLERDGNISVLSHNYQHKTTHHRHAHKVIKQIT